jgi:MoxR-like ATPase
VTVETFKPVSAITDFATILMPEESEAPILSSSVRGAMHQWLVELGAGEELRAVGLDVRRTALLSGPPGCGKTTLAHHLAARLGLPLVLVDMAALRSQYIGETGQNIVRLFRAVRQQQDSLVLFLDEFDGIAMARTQVRQGSDREGNSIVVAMLQHIDRFKGVMLAATNRADSIDPAIWRRFGMQIVIDLPDDEGRFAIIKRYLDPMALPDAALDVICELTAGATPALLRQVVEGVKRDIVLASRFRLPADARSVFSRIIAAIGPHAEATKPLLWDGAWALDRLAGLPWPPTLPDSKGEAA